MATVKNQFQVEFDEQEVLSSEDIAMYESNPTTLVLEKTNKAPSDAKIGTVYTYVCSIENIGETSATVAKFKDELQSNIEYVVGSFKVDDVLAIPITTDPLTYIIANILPKSKVVITFDVKIVS